MEAKNLCFSVIRRGICETSHDVVFSYHIFPPCQISIVGAGTQQDLLLSSSSYSQVRSCPTILHSVPLVSAPSKAEAYP